MIIGLSPHSSRTDGYSGAEIEEIIVSGLYRAFVKKRELEGDDLIVAATQMIPLSKTMAKNIDSLRQWANNRAVAAS